MQKQETLSHEEQFKDATVSFSPFVQYSTGIIQSQTVLKVDTYNLICVPYQFTMGRAVLLASLSKDEVAFFQRFTNALAGLTILVQSPTAREPNKIFCRCMITGIAAMKGRDRVGIIACEFKPIPPDLAAILGEHLMRVERLRAQWSDYRDRVVAVNPASSRQLGFNNYAVMTAGAEQHKLALFSLAVNRLDFLMPMRSPDIAPGTQVSFSLYFQRFRFTVGGKIGSSKRLPTGIQRLGATLEFSPELCDVMSDYFFLARTAAKEG
jgi:hypothetical protein